MSHHVLVGRYELSDRLGIGGMAEVYLGKDRVLGRTIAVKTLLAQFAHDPSFIARFKREATSAAQLNHPNIVGVFDTGSDDGRQFIVMEYVDGRTLKDVIREEGPLLPERAAEIAAEVCSALQFAHAHGIIHRDVKPGNIMINSRGEVKVADFGIARAASGETVTQTATVLGTAQYFSPEQAQAAPVDARSDLYSLGVVLYEMLTRQVPFTGSSPVAIAYKHVKEDAIPPSRLNSDIPPALEAVVMKALAKNPDNRYQSAQEMRGDLERAIRGQPINAPRVMTPAEHTAVMSAVGDDATVMLRGSAVRTQTARAKPPPRRGTGIALLGLIAAGMIGVIIWALIGLLPKSPNTFALGTYAGEPLPKASSDLAALGLVPSASFTPDPNTSNNTVIRTIPDAGAQVRKGDQITLVTSNGKPKVTIPTDLVGKNKTDAESELRRANLVPRMIPHADSNHPPDIVLSTSPAGGQQVEQGSTVDVVYSTGPEQVTVPNEIGKSESQARADLTGAGFNVHVQYETSGPGCPQPDGYVCDQNPSGGTAAKGSRVDIFVAQAPSPTETSSPTPSESPS